MRRLLLAGLLAWTLAIVAAPHNTSAHTGWHWSGGYVCFNNKLMQRYQWAYAVQYSNGYGGYYWGHSWTGELAYMYPSGWCI
jgi:hypothetical protein